jgi:hypothetical protein
LAVERSLFLSLAAAAALLLPDRFAAVVDSRIEPALVDALLAPVESVV